MFRIIGEIQVGEITLLWIIFAIVLLILLILLKEFLQNCFFKSKDTGITEKIIDKFPLVSENFMNKPPKEQIIENNQEIHELNLQIEDLKKQIAELKGGNNAD